MTIKKLHIPFIIIIFLFLSFTCISNNPQNSGGIKNSGNKEKTSAIDDPDYFTKDYLHYEDYIYNENIKTIVFSKNGFVFSSPIINFGSEETINLSFDDLSGDLKTFKYTFILCDAYWKPSKLKQNEYIEFNSEDIITDFKFSRSTHQKFVHYSLIFPNENLKPIKAGNYVLLVFNDDESKTPVLTRRFFVADQQVTIDAKVAKPVSVEYQKYKQSVDFSINRANYYIANPYQDLNVIITQNGRWDNAILNLKPRIVKGDILDYSYEDETTFSGGNEFRSFDIKSLRYYSERVKKITRDSVSNTNIILFDDERRPFKTYQTKTEIKGKMYVKSEDNVVDSDIEAEYVMVHFFLKYDAPLVDGSIYIMGAITDWRFSKEALMKYNYTKKGYEAVLYLKQGYYTYEYVFLENGKKVGDETLVEGMHFETNNDYTIYVYNRETGLDYDKLIGVKQINTYTTTNN